MTAPCIIGVYGSDGKTYYTWIKYADDASGTNMSDDPTGKKYMGIAINKTTATESNDADVYTWSLIKGTDGKGVSKVETWYYLSTSETVLVGGSWSTSAPTWTDGTYLWTKLVTTYTDGDTEESDPVVDASWKKTSAVEKASIEFNESLINALGLYVTEVSVSGTVVKYYHSKSPLASCGEGDIILLFNSSGFGVCTTGWNDGKPDFDNGMEFGQGKAIWNILAANKISADLIEAGVIKSSDGAPIKSDFSLNTGKFTLKSNSQNESFGFGANRNNHLLLQYNYSDSDKKGVALGYYYGGRFYEDSAHTELIEASEDYYYGDIPSGSYYQYSSGAYSKLADLSDVYKTYKGFIMHSMGYTQPYASYEGLILSDFNANLEYFGGLFGIYDTEEVEKRTPVFKFYDFENESANGSSHYTAIRKQSIVTKQLGAETFCFYLNGNVVDLATLFIDISAELETERSQIASLQESLTALQKKYTALEEALGQVHEHTAKTAVKENVVEATCETAGSYDSVVYCATCNEEISREEITIEALGHTYTSVVTPPTATAQGYTTHTCSRCGDSYVDSYTDPTGSETAESMTVKLTNGSNSASEGDSFYFSNNNQGTDILGTNKVFNKGDGYVWVVAKPGTGRKLVRLEAYVNGELADSQTLDQTSIWATTIMYMADYAGKTVEYKMYFSGAGTSTFIVSKGGDTTSADSVQIFDSSYNSIGTTAEVSYGESIHIEGGTVSGRQITSIEVVVDGVSSGTISSSDLISVGYLTSSRTTVAMPVNFVDPNWAGTTREYIIYFATA